MATMYPREPFGARSRAEVVLFNALKDQLPDNVLVFYSVAWLTRRRPDERPADGESDFVVLAPNRGLLTIEVKGGQITFDPVDGWHTQPYGATHTESIRDPFLQARDNKYSLRRKLLSLPAWGNRYLPDGHAVAFPDSIAPAYPPRPDADPTIVISAPDLSHLAARVDAIFDFWAARDDRGRSVGLDRAAVNLITDTLARRWELRAPRLSDTLVQETERQVQLTQKQFELLDFLAAHRRAVIGGPAGSGKTMIALEKARRLSADGFRTLLLCFNRPLADYLRTIVPNQDGLVINSIHRFCGELVHSTVEETGHTDEFYRTILPNALLDAAAELPQSLLFDAIVIDESQDFRAEWLDAIELLLRDRAGGVLYVFYDDNQNLYGGDLSGLGLGAPFLLSDNCRNTQHIYEALTSYYRASHSIRCIGPEGEPVRIRTYRSTSDLVEQLTYLAAELVFAEEVPTASIVMLTDHKQANSPLANIDRIGSFELTDSDRKGQRQLRLATIHRFKGLERPVVILVLGERDAGRPEDEHSHDQLLYVGMSRACNRLFVFAPAGMKLTPQVSLKRLSST